MTFRECEELRREQNIESANWTHWRLSRSADAIVRSYRNPEEVGGRRACVAPSLGSLGWPDESRSIHARVIH